MILEVISGPVQTFKLLEDTSGMHQLTGKMRDPQPPDLEMRALWSPVQTPSCFLEMILQVLTTHCEYSK